MELLSPQRQSELEYRLQYEKLISRISSDFTRHSLNNMDSAIHNALAAVGQFTKSDRAYLFQFKNETEQMDNTHEWCAEGIEPQIDNLKNLTLNKQLPWLAEKIRNGRMLVISDVLSLPPQAAVERDHFAGQTIRSLMTAPASSGDRLYGLVGLDVVHTQKNWAEEEKILLQLVADMIARTIEKIQYDQKLRESEYRYRMLMDSIDAGIAIIDPQTHIIEHVNQAAALIFGAQPDKITGHVCHQFLCPRNAGQCPITNLGRNVYKSDCIVLAADKSEKPVLKSVKQIRIDGKDKLLETFIDINERKLAELQLQKTNERFNQLARQSRTVHWEVDARGMLIYLSPVSETVYGYKPQELVWKKYLYDLHPAENRESFKSAALTVFRQKDSFQNMENLIQTKDGNLIWVSTSGLPVLDEQGNLLGYCGSDTDITDRKNAELMLKQEQHRLFNMIEGTRTGTWEWNIQTGQTVFNRRWAQMLGYELEELAPVSIKTWEQLTCPEDLAKSYEFLLRHFAGELPHYDFEIRMKHRDGRWIWVHDRGRVVTWTDDGKPLMMFGTHTDITERKESEHLQNQLMQELADSKSRLEDTNEYLKIQNERAKELASQAQAASITKSQFLANMSHEIRTPLNAIISIAELLSEEELTGRQKTDIATIMDSGRNLLDLINDILDLSKIEAARLEVEMIECSLSRILNLVDSMMKFKAEEKSIDFQVIHAAGLPEKICTDPTRLKQCLINLSNNAVKFTDKGHVHLKVSRVDKINQPYIRFDVEDTGIGIPADKQQAVFESFTQVDSSTTRKYGGTGLGLTITKKLAELLGGEITLTSRPGKGSVFSLIIPAGVKVENQPLLNLGVLHSIPKKSDLTGMTFSGRVLVAEDVLANQMVIKRLLEKASLNVDIANDGQEAVTKILTGHYDLIFMDMQMPNMNGYEASTELRKAGVKVPIVALTANAMKGDDNKCMEAGCNDYLAKPIDRKKLCEILTKYLSPTDGTNGRPLTEPVGSVTNQVLKLADPMEVQTDRPDRLPEEKPCNVINWVELINRVGEDEELIKDIAQAWLAQNPSMLTALEEAVKLKNAKNILSLAHTIKGCSATIGANSLALASLAIESACKEGKLDNIEILFSKVKQDSEKVESFLSLSDWMSISKRQLTS